MSRSAPTVSPPKVEKFLPLTPTLFGLTASALAMASPPPWVEAEVVTSEWTAPTIVASFLMLIVVALMPFVRPASEVALAAPVVVVASVT